MITERANTAEKSEAWDRLMKSTKAADAEAVQEAWDWLFDTVSRREASEKAAAATVIETEFGPVCTD